MLRHWTVLLGMSIGLALPLAIAPNAHANDDRNVTLEQLPEPVRATVLRETKGGQIREIEEKTDDGQTKFEVEFTTPDGHKSELKIAPDGRVLKREIKY